MKAVILLCLAILTGCASMNDAMTPSLSVKVDDFDGRTIVHQPPVSSSSSLSEGWHAMGFEWSDSFPDTAFITVGTDGITNVTEVAFNVDGEMVSSVKTASAITEYGGWSTRRFQMPLADFLKVANGKVVKMKVVRINDYSVSSFGSEVSGAIVNSKFAPFVAKVQELRATASK